MTRNHQWEITLAKTEAAAWKSAWRWMLVVTVLSNAGWAWAWWVYR